MSDYQVGQRVWIYGINDRGRGPSEGKISKVGRTLVSVEDQYGRVQQFRMDTREFNSRDYPHHYWIRTDDERVDEEHRAEINARLSDAGVTFRLGARLPVEVLEDFVAVLDKHGIGGAT